MANISGDDAAKSIFGVLLVALLGAVGWLIRAVLGGRENEILTAGQIKALEAKVAELEKNELTRECIREEIETALEKRDKQAEQRNEERAVLRKFEMRSIVNEELDRIVPKIVHEIRGTTGVVKLQLPPDRTQ